MGDEEIEVSQIVDILFAKKSIEEHVSDLRDDLPEGTSLFNPKIRKNKDSYDMRHVVEAPSMSRANLVDIVDMFHEYYPGKSAFDPNFFLKFGAKYKFTRTMENQEGGMTKRTEIALTYNTGGVLQQKDGGSRRLEPYLDVEFSTSPYLDRRDVEFNKLVYDVLIPTPEEGQSVAALERLGCEVVTDLAEYGWDRLAGYEKTKKQIRDIIIRPNTDIESFKRLWESTRSNPDMLSYNCFMMVGPPGVGKTEMGKIVANELGRPYVELQLENVVSKWYGEAEQRVGKILDRAMNNGPTLLFIDEIDGLVGDRKNSNDQVLPRILNVLNRKLVQVKLGGDLIVLAATNMPEKMDSAFRRRFRQQILFPLPNREELAAIYGMYSQHLTPEDLRSLASTSSGFSGDDVLGACTFAEAYFMGDDWDTEEHLPGIDYYMDGINTVLQIKEEKNKRKIGFGRGDK